MSIEGDMLSRDALPQSLVASSLDVLRGLTANERDLIRVVVEIIQELREDDEDEEEPAVCLCPILRVHLLTVFH